MAARAVAARSDGRTAARWAVAGRHGRTAVAGGCARGGCVARRPRGEMAAEPLPGETAALRDGRRRAVERRPRGETAAWRQHDETAARWLRVETAALGLSPDCTAARFHAAARQHGGAAMRRTSKHPRGETATARRDSDRESECLVSRAVAARHGKMGSRRTARPHGRTAMRRDGGAADAWPQAVHRPCTVWRGTQPRGAGRSARRDGVHGELAARPLPGGWPHGETAFGARWMRGETATRRDGSNESSGRGRIRGRSLAEFRDSGDCGVPGLQPRSMQNA
jgi:hypothetical protein